ncbi:MAG: serine/threonine-protein kinase [Lysobacteraceae bacterium]
MTSTVLLKSVDIHIPGYRILRPVGEGGMASVFLAVQESLDREVALKVMAPALAANAEFTDRFLKEGRITAKLSHPNLVTVFDIGSHGTVYYLAAEYIPGGTLRERVDKGLPVGESLDIVCDVARGLQFAHDMGFVHRDVKPGNVLFKADGTAVLADFGIAKAMDAKSGATMAGASIGTPDYMSPEQARAEQVDGRSDLYSLGVMLYEMLTGETPYQASDPFTVALMHVTQPVPTLPPEHAWLQPLLDGLMAKSVDNRLASGDSFVAAVEQLLAAAPEAEALKAATPARKRSGARRSGNTTLRGAKAVERGAEGGLPRWLLPAGVAVAVGALALILVLWLLPTTEEKPAEIGDGTESALPPVVLVPSPVDMSDVESLLAQADANREYGTTKEPGRKLTSPSGDSAVDLYRKVLDIEAGNARALEGLAVIGEYYRQRSETMCERQLWGNCRILAEEGLKAQPDDGALRDLLARAEKGALGG